MLTWLTWLRANLHRFRSRHPAFFNQLYHFYLYAGRYFDRRPESWRGWWQFSRPGVGGLQKGGLGALKKITGFETAGRLISSVRETRKAAIKEEKGGLWTERMGAKAYRGYVGAKSIAAKPYQAARGAITGGWRGTKWGAEAAEKRKQRDIVRAAAAAADEKKREGRRRRVEADMYGSTTGNDQKKYYFDRSNNFYKETDWDTATNKPKGGTKALSGKEREDLDLGQKKASAWDYIVQGARTRIERGSSRAKEVANQAEDQKISRIAKQYDGLDSNSLARILNDHTASQEERMAAAITLAIKRGFKEGQQGKEQFNMAKQLIGNNSPLLNKFSKAIKDGGMADIAYDLNNPEDQKDFEQDILSGDVDLKRQRHALLRDKTNLETIKKIKGDVGFAKFVDDESKLSANHHKAFEETLPEMSGFEGDVMDPITKKISIERKMNGSTYR